MEDLQANIKGNENFLDKLMRKIPGFEGYKNREQSRTADQIQRKFMAQTLTEHKGRLMSIGQEMLRSGNMSLLSEVDRVSKVIDKLIEKIEHAAYGYSGLFDAVKIDEAQLDTLYEYDMGMINDIAFVGESLEGLEYSLDVEGSNPKARLRDVEKAVKGLDAKVANRKKVLMGVE